MFKPRLNPQNAIYNNNFKHAETFYTNQILFYIPTFPSLLKDFCQFYLLRKSSKIAVFFGIREVVLLSWYSLGNCFSFEETRDLSYFNLFLFHLLSTSRFWHNLRNPQNKSFISHTILSRVMTEAFISAVSTEVDSISALWRFPYHRRPFFSEYTLQNFTDIYYTFIFLVMHNIVYFLSL